jgi:hypothetical protein
MVTWNARRWKSNTIVGHSFFFSSLNGATLLLLSSNTNIQFKRRLNFAQPLKNSIDHIAFSIMEGSLLKRLDLYGRAYMFVVLASFNKKRKTQLIFIKFVCLVAEGVPNSWQFICSLPFFANSDPHDVYDVRSTVRSSFVCPQTRLNCL